MTTPPKKGKRALPRTPKAGTPESRTEVLLEEIRAQNRATIEAVQATRQQLQGAVDDLRREHSMRLEVLEGVVRQNSVDIRQQGERLDRNTEAIGVLQEAVTELQGEVKGHSRELARLSAVVDRLDDHERRIDALEKKTGSA